LPHFLWDGKENEGGLRVANPLIDDKSTDKRGLLLLCNDLAMLKRVQHDYLFFGSPRRANALLVMTGYSFMRLLYDGKTLNISDLFVLLRRMLQGSIKGRFLSGKM